MAGVVVVAFDVQRVRFADNMTFRRQNFGKRIPIVRIKFVKQIAAELDITLLFLPPYSPNLNLIERLWKFVKKRALNNRYYEN